MHVLVTYKNEDDQIKKKVLDCSQDFSHYGDFLRRSRAANSAVLGPIWPSFELVRDVIDNLITCQYEDDPIKNRGAKVFVHNIIHQFFRRARVDNSEVGGGIWPKFECIQVLMHVLVICKNEDDRLKNEGARVFTRFLPL